MTNKQRNPQSKKPSKGKKGVGTYKESTACWVDQAGAFFQQEAETLPQKKQRWRNQHQISQQAEECGSADKHCCDSQQTMKQKMRTKKKNRWVFAKTAFYTNSKPSFHPQISLYQQSLWKYPNNYLDKTSYEKEESPSFSKWGRGVRICCDGQCRIREVVCVG